MPCCVRDCWRGASCPYLRRRRCFFRHWEGDTAVASVVAEDAGVGGDVLACMTALVNAVERLESLIRAIPQKRVQQRSTNGSSTTVALEDEWLPGTGTWVPLGPEEIEMIPLERVSRTHRGPDRGPRASRGHGSDSWCSGTTSQSRFAPQRRC